MKNNAHCKKGQMTIINLIVAIAVIVMFFAFLPIMINYTDEIAVPAIAGSSADQPTKDITTAVVNLFTLIIALSVLITILYYAIPRREGI